MTRRSKRRPSFFKVLLGEFSHQLQIPPAFLTHFDGKVPQQFHLRTSAGTWCVNLEKVNDRFFFQKGWKKFVHDNGLKLCEFLVFRYAQNLRFYVDIYGRDCCKKELVIHRKMPTNHGKQNVDNQGLQVSAYGTRTSQTIIHIKDETTDDTDSEKSMHPLATSTGKAFALQRDNGFESENPFFKVVMRDSYIHRCYSAFPAKFANAHLTEKPSIVTLRVSDGRTWPVKVGFQTKACQTQMLGGWSAFVRDNDLKFGDVCVFVLINKTKFLFEAVIHRKAEAANHILSPEIPLQTAKGFNSENPFFKVAMQNSSISRGYMCVPSKFVKTHLADRPSNLTFRVSDGRTWPVKMVYKWEGRIFGGWPAFRRDNNLEVGDECVFVLVNKVEFLFEAVIYRKAEVSNCALSPGKRQGRINGNREIKGEAS